MFSMIETSFHTLQINRVSSFHNECTEEDSDCTVTGYVGAFHSLHKLTWRVWFPRLVRENPRPLSSWY